MTARPKAVFLDTDIGPDCDDAAALAILLQLCREGYSELLGITHCTGSPYGLATIDAICRRFDVHVPIGTCADKTFLNDARAWKYTLPVSERFEHAFPADAPQPDALDTFIQALRAAGDRKVTLIGIGPLINIARFLNDPVAGPLMRERVERIILMAGAFEVDPLFTEWNIEMDIPAAQTVLRTWDGPLDLCPFEAMHEVLTGECLRDSDTPVAMAYRLFTEGAMLRPSWDLVTVAIAAADSLEPYEWSPCGTITIGEKGLLSFTTSPNGNHRYLRLTGTAEQAAINVETLLTRADLTMRQ